MEPAHVKYIIRCRSDIRKQDAVQGRSINMTIAIRGLDALQRIGIKDTVLDKRLVLEPGSMNLKSAVKAKIITASTYI